MSIAIYDTACGSLNSGDSIIMEAVGAQLDRLFPLEHKARYPTHYPLSFRALRRLARAQLVFVAGTNLLTSNVSFLSKKNQWALGYLGAQLIGSRAILVGCGWKSYHEPHRALARRFYQSILASQYTHSVRDAYTEQQMRELGVHQVCNTGCPTLWPLTPDHCLTIPERLSERVVFTLTDYRRDPRLDLQMIRTLSSLYREILFWIQGSKDLTYIKSLLNDSEIRRVHLIGPSLDAYDRCLRSDGSLDYVGTRLHAGIRALQMKRRCLIIGVDNRAMEMQRDFNLPVLARDRMDELGEVLQGSIAARPRIPFDTIAAWCDQFRLGWAQ